MIKFENRCGSGLEWPEHSVAIKPGANEFESLPDAMIRRLKTMHENGQGSLELPGLKCVNGAWVIDEAPVAAPDPEPAAAPEPVIESRPQGNDKNKR